MRVVAFWLSLGMIFTLPWEKMVPLPVFGSLNQVVGLFVAGIWILAIIATGQFRRLRPFHITPYLFVLWNVISILWSVDTDRTITRVLTYFQLLALTWMLWDLYPTSTALKSGLQAYVLGAYISIASILYNWMNGIVTEHGRFTATGVNANDASLIWALGIPMAWYLAARLESGHHIYWLKLLNYAYVPIAAFCIVLTASRGSIISSLPATLFIIGTITRLKFAQKILVFACLTAALYFMIPLIPQTSLERISTTGMEIEDLDFNGRVAIWERGLATFQKYPIFGVGSNAFRTATHTGRAAHNTFLSVLVDTGIIGFTIFSAMLIIAIYQALQQPHWDAWLWFTLLFIWGVGATVHNWEQTKHTWLLLTLVGVGANLIQEKGQSHPEDQVSLEDENRTEHEANPEAEYTIPQKMAEPSIFIT